jgi:hypothetical protein
LVEKAQLTMSLTVKEEDVMQRPSKRTSRFHSFCAALILSAGGILLLSASMCPPSFAATDIPLKIYGPSCAPRGIYTGIPSPVTVEVTIDPDPSLIAASVNLLRVFPDGTRKVVDRLYDDGTHADMKPGDGTFANQITFNEPQPTTIKLQASAGYKGQIQRRISDVCILEVAPGPNFEPIWKGLLDRLVNKDLEGALRYFSDQKKQVYRRIFSEVGMDLIAADFSTARDFKLDRISGGTAQFTFTATVDGQDKKGRVVFEREFDGSWLVRNLGL